MLMAPESNIASAPPWRIVSVSCSPNETGMTWLVPVFRASQVTRFVFMSSQVTAQCDSCRGKWSALQVAEVVLGDREQAMHIYGVSACLMPDPKPPTPASNPIQMISVQNGVNPHSLSASARRWSRPSKSSSLATGPTESSVRRSRSRQRSARKRTRALYQGEEGGSLLPTY